MGFQKMVLFISIAQLVNAFYPSDYLELSRLPGKIDLDSEEYFAKDETSRHDHSETRHDYSRSPSEYSDDYDSREGVDTSTFSSLFHDPQANDALYSPEKSDGNHKREEYFDGLKKKSRGTFHRSRKVAVVSAEDLVAGASDPDHFIPPPRTERNKRARLSDYDLYYPKRQGQNEELGLEIKAKSHPSSRDFGVGNFDDFLHTTSRPVHETESPSGFAYQADSYSKPSHSVHDEPRRPLSETYQIDSFSKPSHSIHDQPRRPLSGSYLTDSFSKPSPGTYQTDSFTKPSSGTYQTDSFSKPTSGKYQTDSFSKPTSGTYQTDSFSKPSHSIHDEPRRPLSGLTYHTDSYSKPSHSEYHHKPSSNPVRKIRQRSKPVDLDSLSPIYRAPKSKNLSSRSMFPRPTSVKQEREFKKSSPRKLSETQGRNVHVDDEDFPNKSRPTPWRKERRQPGLFTEENRHFLSATGYGKPVREQFQEQGTTGPRSYKFGYNTGDRDNPMARYEERGADGLVKGSYSYVDPTGKLQVVHYESHPEHGFRTTH